MLTHLARSINPRYRTVRFGLAVVFISGLGGLGLGLQQGATLGDATARATNLVIATFLAWAVGRELDPDDPASATLASIVTLALTWWAGPASVAALTTLLILTRLVARTTGKAPTALDQMALVALGVWASITAFGWIAALGLSFATARDVRLPGSTSRLQLVTSLAIGVASTVTRFVSNRGVAQEWTIALLAVVAVGLLSGATLRITQPPTSTGDLTRSPLHARRIQSGRRHALVVTSAACLLIGAPAAVGLAPVLAALTATRLRQALGARR